MTANDAQTEDTNPTGMVHGQLVYLQIPATDLVDSATFYSRVFGWQIDPHHPSFDAPGIFGQWVTDRPAAEAAGLLVWIQVDRMTDALEQVRANGGDVLEPPSPDGPTRLLATVRDPGGNALGIVQHGPAR
jgi:predicted enzyme related to lactoylglutathione lyase